MAKLTETQIKQCETDYGDWAEIRHLYEEYGYKKQTPEQKSMFWLLFGKNEILKRGLRLPSFLAEEATKISGSSRDLRDEARDVKKQWAGVRVYAATTNAEAGPGHVVVPLREESGGTMYLPRHGAWELVRYKGDNSVGKVPLAPSAQSTHGHKLGIYTDTIGGCSAVAVLYGNSEAGLGKAFAIAALAHLPGSDPSRIHWPLMYPPGSGAKPDLTGKYVRAVVFVDSAYAADSALSALAKNIGVRGHLVTVYLSGNLSWCGVDHMGRFGITR